MGERPAASGRAATPAGTVPKVELRLFAAARQAAGVARDEFDAATVRGVLDEAARRYGAEFSRVAAGSRVWVNGEPAGPDTPLAPGDEVAVLPPVSGGAAA